MQIAGFDVDDLADGSGKAPITWIGKELLKTERRMNPSVVKNEDGTYVEGTGAVGGWKKCEMRAYLKETIRPIIPKLVREQIAEVTKEYRGCDMSGEFLYESTQEDVWIPERNEVINKNGAYSGLFVNDISRIKAKADASRNTYWWVYYAVGVDYVACIDSIGGINYSINANSSHAIPICFCT